METPACSAHRELMQTTGFAKIVQPDVTLALRLPLVICALQIIQTLVVASVLLVFLSITA